MNAYAGAGAFSAARPAAHPTARLQLTSMRQRSVAQAKLRVLWVILGFAFLAIMAVTRIGFLGLSDTAIAATSLQDALLPDRGSITDRNGVPLARALPASKAARAAICASACCPKKRTLFRISAKSRYKCRRKMTGITRKDRWRLTFWAMLPLTGKGASGWRLC